MNNKISVGLLGYYGKSLDINYNLKVDRVNKLVDQYNSNVSTLPIDKQLDYQKSTLRLCRELLISD